MDKIKKWYSIGVMHMIGAAALSFGAFYILFGVSMDVIKGVALVACLIALSFWLLNRGIDMFSGEVDGRKRR